MSDEPRPSRSRQRLLPVNAVLGLLTPGDVNPSALHDAGFRLAGLEVPVVGDSGKVVVDLVLFHPHALHIVLVETKSGQNLDGGQAGRYSRLTAEDVVHGARLTVPRRGELTVEVVYAGLAEHAGRLTRGLEAADVTFPLILVGREHISLLGGRPSGHLRAALPSAGVPLLAPPPRLLRVDEHSPVDEVVPLVRAELVVGLSRSLPLLHVGDLAARCIAPLDLFADRARSRLIRLVIDAAERVCKQDPDTFVLVPRSAGTDAYVRFLQTPEDLDTRGRTQSYQALARRARPHVSAPRPQTPGQLDLFDELDKVDDGENGGEERT